MDARVTFADERVAAGIDDVLRPLDDDLVGLVPVKRKVQEIAALLLVDQARRRFGLDADRPNLHMCFTGPPGTGKTTVALRMAALLHRLGYLEKGQLVHAMRDDLVGEFIGQTAPKTKRILGQAMGGVLFIDAHHLDFAPCEVGEMIDIGRLMLERARYYLSGDAEEAFREYLARRMRQPRFANARSVRNELERARLRHAYRLTSQPHRAWSRDDLMRIEAADILGT